MTLAIHEAVVRRWNDAGLDSAVASLYPGERWAAPESMPLPRAGYSLSGDMLRNQSRGSRELVQPVRLVVWGLSDAFVAGSLESIAAAFLDSQSAAVNPLSLPAEAGSILSVEYGGRSVVQQDETLFQGVLEINIQWAKPAGLAN
jgi:hypothetical protein